MDSQSWNIEVKDMIKECEKYLAKVEYNDRLFSSDIDDAISMCVYQLKKVINKYSG